jgi:predicted transposase YdaD
LERQNGSYVADDLRERHDDIIWRIRCSDSWFYIYLLIEFQSSVDPWMAVRIMTYIGLLYQDLIKSVHVKSGDMLPSVFPLVLYSGPESLRESLVALKEKLTDKKYQSLNRAFVVWINRVLLNRLMPQESLPEVNDLEEVETMLAERVDEWTEK